MAHDHEFSLAARPDRFTILRLPMLEYSIGHEVLLWNKLNPLLSDKAVFDSLDPVKRNEAIIRACLICCRNWEENKRPHKWIGLWGWRIRKCDFAKAADDFREYRNKGSLYPPTPEDEADFIANAASKGRILGGPYLARLINFMSERVPNPMDSPLGYSQFLFFSWLETEGSLRIENEKEASIRMETAAIREAVAKEKEAEKCQP